MLTANPHLYLPPRRFATEGSGSGIVCPAVLVYRSYGVQVGQVGGRLRGEQRNGWCLESTRTTIDSQPTA